MSDLNATQQRSADAGTNGFIKGAGGLCPVDLPGIENINLTSMIIGHFDYAKKVRIG